MSENNENTRIARLSRASAVLSIVACYAPLALIVILSLLGVTLAINEQIWAGAIVAFAVLAVAGIVIATKGRRKLDALVLGIVGAVLVVLSMYGVGFIEATWGISARIVEATGFVALLVAVWRLNR